MITFIIGFIFGIIGYSLYCHYKYEKAIEDTIEWLEDITEQLKSIEENEVKK